ncbi:hypothetical protein GCM10010172_58040 [Paractinoplanes ferrugineus]|uniref:Uncharacterized protein n=1 Tax=Paractinoplanes ferrugineus TaxID=113564 RepID=A0A919J9S7_9ACTN|nr:CU044_5270 family protein [Actinoplanes ferrugineus]GIE15892.1 hypothetical protein Afe05nite_77320 [Actinoplanes ferrugineus]
MDEISVLRETFEPGAAPSAEAEQRARLALRNRMAAPAPARRRVSWRLSIPVAVTAAAAVTAIAIGTAGGPARVGSPGPAQSAGPVPAPPYLKPVSAAQVLENAAWTAEQETWVDPRPTQFMYVETLEMLNPPEIQRKKPNGAMIPGKAQYRKIQQWERIDGQVRGEIRDGRLQVRTQGQNKSYWAFVPWSQIVELTSPEKVAYYLEHPEGGVLAMPEALAGQYVLPPDVKAALFRYLAERPGMRVNPDAVNLDGRAAIGLGRTVEGYLSEELLFDKQTYTLIGDRLVAVADHVSRSDDGTSYTTRGDLFRQVIYQDMMIVDKPGETN